MFCTVCVSASPSVCVRVRVHYQLAGAEKPHVFLVLPSEHPIRRGQDRDNALGGVHPHAFQTLAPVHTHKSCVSNRSRHVRNLAD